MELHPGSYSMMRAKLETTFCHGHIVRDKNDDVSAKIPPKTFNDYSY